MRPIEEQVDCFIEDFFNGNIITVFHEKADLKGNEPISAALLILNKGVKDFAKAVGEGSESLGRLISEYTKAGATGKAELAYQIYNIIIGLRYVGILQNNPNNLKELSFYRSRAELQAKDIQERDEQIVGAMETIRKLRAELAGKEIFK